MLIIVFFLFSTSKPVQPEGTPAPAISLPKRKNSYDYQIQMGSRAKRAKINELAEKLMFAGDSESSSEDDENDENNEFIVSYVIERSHDGEIVELSHSSEPNINEENVEASLSVGLNAEEVSDNDTNGSNDSDIQSNASETRIERRSNIWTPGEEFLNLNDAKAFLKALGFTGWYTSTAGGVKLYCRCNKVLRTSKVQCNAQRYILIKSNNLGYQIFFNQYPHNHDDLDTRKQNKFSSELVEFIKTKANENWKPKKTIREINELKLNSQRFQADLTPTAAQIHYILRNDRNKECPPICTLGELIELCEKHKRLPVSEDEPFVIGLAHSSASSKQMWFRMAFTTRRLLQNAANVESICVDATYKLNWNGYPLLVCGTVDKNKSFNLISLACCSNEKEADFSFLFKCTRNAFRKTHIGQAFDPKLLISDAADAIRNAFYNTFSNAQLDIMYYAHVVRNIKKADYKNNANKILIKEDISVLQLSKSREVFEELSALFIKKRDSGRARILSVF